MNKQSSPQQSQAQQKRNQLNSPQQNIAQNHQSQQNGQQQFGNAGHHEEARQLKAEHQRELDTADHRTGNFRESDPEQARQEAAQHGNKNA